MYLIHEYIVICKKFRIIYLNLSTTKSNFKVSVDKNEAKLKTRMFITFIMKVLVNLTAAILNPLCCNFFLHKCFLYCQIKNYITKYKRYLRKKPTFLKNNWSLGPSFCNLPTSGSDGNKFSQDMADCN